MQDHDANPSLPKGRISVVHTVVIVLSLLMTLGAWQFSKNQIDARTQTQFEKARERTVSLILERMAKYEDALWAGVSSVKSHDDDISRAEWRTFAQSLKIEKRYPGISGIGVIHYLDDESLPDYLAKQHEEYPEFRVQPEHSGKEYLPISYIEPEASNKAALGLDVAHEVNRREGALASRDTGKAQITGPIYLVQDAGHTPGFLFYAPFYDSDSLTSVSDRRNSIIGAVYAPFVTRKLMEGILDKELREIRFSITDGDTQIYSEHTTQDPLFDSDPMYTEEISIEVYGRTWTFDLRTNLAFRGSNTYSQPTFILLGGLIIEMLVISLLLMMSQANKRTISYANELKQKSEKLSKANGKLEDKNQELEEFAYFASHDLKTPIRGIGGLTELLEDDLEDYLASPDANPDVRVNIARIQDRVKRMNKLIGGIMTFSRIDSVKTSDEPICLARTVRNIVTDFGIAAGQIKLTSDVKVISTDTTSFHRVLENLIGNSIKYHDDVENLELKICAEVNGDRCSISVIDNGPGIDPIYHEKIFDMFQIVSSDRDDSTGIGLAVVKKIVERNAGKVSVETPPTRGAAFRFDWPYSASAEKSFEQISKAA